MLEVKLFPKDMGAIEIDPSNIKKCLVSGLFKEEVEVEAGNKVQFNVQIYGTSPIREGYSLAFKLDNDDSKKSVSVEKDGIEFYVEEQDVWFFDGYDLKVAYDEDKEEVKYEYIEQ